MEMMLLKLTFIPGLLNIALDELSETTDIHIIKTTKDCIYIKTADIGTVLSMRSITNAFIVNQTGNLTPRFISNHKSILGNLIEFVLHTTSTFKTYKLSCAGSDSKEVKSIKKFIADTYHLSEADEADLEAYIGKINGTWECGVRLTARPLSVRPYKKENIKGGINPTIAYAINALCDLKNRTSYLNVFSGSATLLIEAGLVYPKLKLIGFDIDGKRNATAIQNIKAAGLLKVIHLETADIFSKMPVEQFDCITSDLPFGMQISETSDLPELYEKFLEYCSHSLHKNGKLVVYTAQGDFFRDKLTSSVFTIDQTLDITIPTTVSSHIYLHPTIFVCSFR